MNQALDPLGDSIATGNLIAIEALTLCTDSACKQAVAIDIADWIASYAEGGNTPEFQALLGSFLRELFDLMPRCKFKTGEHHD